MTSTGRFKGIRMIRALIAMPMAATLSRGFNRWAAVLGLLLLLWPTPLALAQTGPTLTALTIELWPEYDQPSMLVIMRGTLAPTVVLPTTIILHIPAAAGGPSAVAGQDPTGQLFNIPFTTAAVGDILTVQFEAQLASFQLEYYDPRLTTLGEMRDYTFGWQADFSAEAASLRVQEPPDARDLSAEPPVTWAGSSDLGVNYYTAALGPIAVGQDISVHLRYAKTTNALTISALNQPPGAPAMSDANPATVAWTPSPQLLIGAALGLVGIGMMGWGAVWLARSWRHPARRRRPPRTTSTPMSSSVTNSSARFCTQCGQPHLAGDRFCRQCGAPVRSTPTD